MKNFEIIKLLASSNSRIFKEEVILKEMDNQNEIFFEGMTFAYNRLLTFGIKKVPEAISEGTGLNWQEFKSLANDLVDRKLTGHAARDKIIYIMNKSQKNEWNFFLRRILQKDIMTLQRLCSKFLRIFVLIC